ncbi:hypothetical protein [Hymenobacter sp. BT730]|uniref:hypothetical protein n=1 Tax=Hymenobacter sp. BT730 TaxID=3063332 RepID=UPI0026E02F00|nr:hypothetical protein [Hymenobacter sp. BT730]
MQTRPFMAFEKLFRIARCIHLPGLGLLALPDQPSAKLLQLPLHSGLQVYLGEPNASALPLFGTVEEVHFAGEEATPELPAVVGLLLESSTATALPPNTELWWQVTD